MCGSYALIQSSVMQQRRHRRIKANGAFTLANPHPNSPVFPHYNSGSLMRIKGVHIALPEMGCGLTLYVNTALKNLAAVHLLPYTSTSTIHQLAGGAMSLVLR